MTIAASSDARNATTPAISAGVAARWMIDARRANSDGSASAGYASREGSRCRRARAHAVHPEPRPAELDRHRLREHHDTTLRRGVRGVVGQARGVPRTDAMFTIAPPASSSEVERGLAHQEGAGEVDRERAVPVVERQLAGGRERPHAGDVGEHVQTTEPVDGRGHRLGARGRVGDVATQRQRRARCASASSSTSTPATRAPSLVSRSTVARRYRHRRPSPALPVVEAAHWPGS